MSSDLKFISLTWMLTHLLLHVTGQAWYEHEGKCYTILSGANNFDSSRVYCQRYGSRMVELGDETELHFVRTLIDGSGDQFWVGLNFNNATEQFLWDRGGQEPIDSLWLPNEPDQSGYCAQLTTQSLSTGTSSGTTYLLADNPCSSINKVICEKDADLLETVNYWEIRISSNNTCPMSSYRTWSKMRCAQNCANNKSCIGFQYDDQTQACSYYKFAVSCPMPQEALLSMYVMEYSRC